MRFLRWIGQYNKALVAFTMAIIYFFNARYGIELPIDEESVTIFWLTISGILTYLVPNVKKENM